MRSIGSTTSSATTSNHISSNMSNSNLLVNNAANSNSNVQRLDWETLRKQARQLENEIDSKLVAYSKLCSSVSASSYSTPSYMNSSGISTSAVASSSSSSDMLFMTLSNEIEEALKKLTFINSKMSDSIGNEMMRDVNSSATVHTLQRHRDILRDYSHEYEKTKRNIMNYKEREKLLAPSSSSGMRMSTESNLNNRLNGNSANSNNASTLLYMKEYDHLKSSHSLIDQQLEIAEHTKENLQSQKQSLRLIQQKMNTLAHKFPLINNLVQRVKMKKRKDSLILAAVISFCIILMLLYIF